MSYASTRGLAVHGRTETVLIATRTIMLDKIGYTIMFLADERTESVFLGYKGETDEEYVEYLRGVLQMVSAMIAKHNPDRIRTGELEADWREATFKYDGEGDENR